MQAVSLDYAVCPSDLGDLELMANAAQFAALEERVSNHIKFFWVVVAFGFVWLGAITAFLVQINSTVSHAETTRTTLMNRVAAAELGTLKAALETAQQTGQVIPDTQLVDYKHALQQSPTSVSGYWTTVASIINYQSFLDQVQGRAPDPTAVSNHCFIVAPNSYNNIYQDVPFSNCVVDLDTNSFSNVVFQNSVVRYRGGPVSLKNVRFVNCRFVLDIPTAAPVNRERDQLLMTLFNAPDTKIITIPSTRSPA